ncbi:hypothetical protein [Adhaeribacter radiodurans]|uniref:Outer membrane protein beta-barrel domain-containing protein n=1 Tax=Adhaeribacter radiodurans TaxID=2745197 RepID=A0A7L7L4N4_9BACT|nr:hypothetical protein [Adhaeribacter radiodurans]QMU27756.1 hypothetical protein HUW48_06725 [Adhaeribacter radiodurans]
MKILIALFLIIFPCILQAQTNSSSSYWGITLHGGPFVSGLPSHLEERMKSQGYLPHSGGLFGTGASIPMAKRTIVIQVGVERNWNKLGLVNLLFSTYSGKLSGISSQNGDLNLNYKIKAINFLGGIHLNHRTMRLAIGPAWYAINVIGDRPFDTLVPLKKNFNKLGFAVESGIRFPKEGLLFADFNVQYQKVGKIDMGTYSFEEVDASGQLQTVNFSAGEKSFNYLVINFGLGLRL